MPANLSVSVHSETFAVFIHGLSNKSIGTAPNPVYRKNSMPPHPVLRGLQASNSNFAQKKIRNILNPPLQEMAAWTKMVFPMVCFLSYFLIPTFRITVSPTRFEESYLASICNKNHTEQRIAFSIHEHHCQGTSRYNSPRQ
jgi:hypothetical protein